MTTLLERARDAARQGAWSEARDLFAQVDDSSLDPGDLEAMADAAWWSCRIDESISARQKAYAGYLESGDVRRAGYVAWLLSVDHSIKGESSLMTGWLKRAQRHLSTDPECVERGFVAVSESDIALSEDDLEQARARAELAVELGDRCGSLDLHALGLQALGRSLMALGNTRDGLATLDEAMTLVLGQRLRPVFTGWIYCTSLAACMERADLDRASEWTEAALHWCDSISDLTPYHGICRMHRVEITALRGDWVRAESEARRTVEEMEGLEQHVVAEALYAIGEICLRRGDLTAAEDWFARAHEKGRDPQPGLSAIRLAQGNVEAAAAGLRLSLASAVVPTLQRARLLAQRVEVAIAANDLHTALTSAGALEHIAADTPTALLEAIALTARAWVCLAGDLVDDCLQNARRAWSLWQKMKLPYDAARTRMMIGMASERAGDLDRAHAELEAARSAFEQLGAKLDGRAVAEHLRDATGLPCGLSARELEVLRLVASGKTNREIAAVMVISEHTVSRHLQNIFRKLDVPSRAAATAFAFENALV